ncbi:hypothetical protein PAHAL_1G352700 [Panicum hallii]|uniref:Pectinesterase inhibitor domain-containing protein n=1 Tax=Panicum hallii TaxID=206008 RepID=A0A2S3GS48_9POAL|nr:hypothetical protein PAHAL_1G352700 [Panicum hallii]
MVQPIAIILLAVVIAPGLAACSSSVINATYYCVGVLSGNPAAAAATDVRGLAAAAINITADKAASTLRVISYLVDELSICRGYYAYMLQSLAIVAADFGAGRFENASFEMSGNATGYPQACDILLFAGNSHKDPVFKENAENDLLVRLASSILNLLTGARI